MLVLHCYIATPLPLCPAYYDLQSLDGPNIYLVHIYILFGTTTQPLPALYPCLSAIGSPAPGVPQSGHSPRPAAPLPWPRCSSAPGCTLCSQVLSSSSPILSGLVAFILRILVIRILIIKPLFLLQVSSRDEKPKYHRDKPVFQQKEHRSWREKGDIPWTWNCEGSWSTAEKEECTFCQHALSSNSREGVNI